MEDERIVMLKHHFMHFGFDNVTYTNQCDDLNDRVIIDVTQRDKKYGLGLSPMKLGPLTSFDGVLCKTFEEFYQTSKVYPSLDTNGMPNEKYYEWRNAHYKMSLEDTSPSDLRHPQAELGHAPKDCIYTIYHDGEKLVKLDYVESRKKIYISNYAKLVVKTDEYKEIKKIYDSGKKIALVDFDAYNYYNEEVLKKAYKKYKADSKKFNRDCTLTEADFTKIKTIKDVINCPYMLAGHGFVIKMLLEGDISVNEDGTINDPDGLLK